MPKPDNSKRLFAGIPIPAALRIEKARARLQEQLRTERIRWTDLRNLHLTLWFFGSVKTEGIPQIISTLSGLTPRFFPFEICIKGAGSFGRLDHPTIIWLGVEEMVVREEVNTRSDKGEKTEASSLQKIFAAPLSDWEKMSLNVDKSEFHPHLTLGRIRALSDSQGFRHCLEEFRDVSLLVTTVKELCLYESILHPEGPEYVVLERFLLGERTN